MSDRDYQRSRVYDWEHDIIAPRDTSRVPFNRIQPLVDYIWTSEGLNFPPKVMPIPKQTRRWLATGNRAEQRYHENRLVSTCVIIHETTHSLLHTFDGYGYAAHGKEFVGLYMKLLDKYCGIPLSLLMYTATERGVKFDLRATVVFTDTVQE